MRPVAVAGVGMTAFGQQPDGSIEELGREAVRAALSDAGLDNDRVDAAYVGNVLGGGSAGQRVLVGLGITGIPVVNVENACASGSSAFLEAWRAVGHGLAEVALVLGVEKLSGQFDGVITLDRGDREAQLGMTLPATYAMVAQRHMAEFGTSGEQLAAVAVKNRLHGERNPRAMFRTRTSIEEVLGSPMVADPLTLYQCCAKSDGAAAAVLVAADAATDRDRPLVKVLASELKSGTPLGGGTGITRGDITRRTAKAAYARAKLGPESVDVAEVHDAFTIGEIVASEALGFCLPGEGGVVAAAGETGLGGRLPVNPSGGLLSKGHPVAATGVAQIAELVWQLRGQAGDRQVVGARVGLAHTVGGGVATLDGVACVVTVLAT